MESNKKIRMENDRTCNTKKETIFAFISIMLNLTIAALLPYFLIKHYIIIEVYFNAIFPVILIFIFAILEMLIAKFLRQQEEAKGNFCEEIYNPVAGILFCSMILMPFPYLILSAVSMPQEETKLIQSKLNTDASLFILKSATDEELIKAYNQIKNEINTKHQCETNSKEQKEKSLERLDKLLQ